MILMVIATSKLSCLRVNQPAGGINSPGGTGPFCAPTPNLTFTISDY